MLCILRNNKPTLLLMIVNSNIWLAQEAVGLTPEFSGHQFSPLPSSLLIPELSSSVFVPRAKITIIHYYFLKRFQSVSVGGELSSWGKGRKERWWLDGVSVPSAGREMSSATGGRWSWCFDTCQVLIPEGARQSSGTCLDKSEQV